MASKSTFEEEKLKLLEETKRINKKIMRAKEDINFYETKLWDLHMKCYMEGKDKCVQRYDQYFLQYNRLKRRRADVQSCFERCMGNITLEEYQKFDLVDQDSLEKYKTYKDCSKPCLEKSFENYENEQDFLRKTISKLSEEFYPDNK
ncbi:unnamed protein product [Blepharisma stoltei]|uniref:Uncharacterized protein n=1 Tax=Blepharisma stoltei TaxID=1481888 RepID=A0AAU9J1S7_9CILI|nr:unnamed protein product [Blepharisma stoltei]